jgi:hypothetical protein
MWGGVLSVVLRPQATTRQPPQAHHHCQQKVNFRGTTRHCIPADTTLHIHGCEDLKSYTSTLVLSASNCEKTFHIVTLRLKAELVEPEETSTTGERVSKHVPAETKRDNVVC